MKFSDLDVSPPEPNKVDMSDVWGEGAVVYGTPVTPLDMEKVCKKHKCSIENLTTGALVDLIILKCRNGDDDRFFTIEDRPKLMRMPMEIIGRLAESFGGADYEEVEKN